MLPPGSGTAITPSEQAEHEPEREPGALDLPGAPLGVAQEGGDLLHPVAGSDDAHPVADLEHEVVGGQQVDVPTTDARGRCAVAPVRAQVGDRASGDVVVGDGHAAEVELAAVQGEVVGAGPAQSRSDLVHGRLGPMTVTTSPGDGRNPSVATCTTPSCSTREKMTCPSSTIDPSSGASVAVTRMSACTRSGGGSSAASISAARGNRARPIRPTAATIPSTPPM